jgi:acetylornithine deacetylase
MSALELTKTLIAFDTTSRGSNLSLIEFAENRRSYDAGGTKANLFATFGPEGDGGIVLSGHTDVVPVDGQDWSSDPFHPEIRGDKLFGRGACDMKGFLGVALSLLPEIAKTPLKKPLHFALSYDEEVGCTGVLGLLDDLKTAGIRPALAIIGEPTLMQVVGAHKAGAKLVTRCLERTARRCRSAFRSAPFHRAGHGDRRRHRGQHPGARGRGDLGISLPARPRSERDPGQCGTAAAARDRAEIP